MYSEDGDTIKSSPSADRYADGTVPDGVALDCVVNGAGVDGW